MSAWRVAEFAFPAGLVLGAVFLACGTEAKGIEACRRIEEARCKRAPACNLDLSVPPHRDAPEQDINACVRYYRDACLHGLMVEDPGNQRVTACVDAINQGPCAVTQYPEQHPACAWLVPPPEEPEPDAGADATENAAAPDAGDDSGTPIWNVPGI